MAAIETMVETENMVTREQAFEELYEAAFPVVARFVRKMGGSLPDAKDIFQDALVIFFEKEKNGTLPEIGTPEAYILGISKHLWLRKFKQDKGKVSLSELEQEISIPEDYFDKSHNRLLAVLQVSGRKCLELLRAFYYDQLNLTDIANAFGFRTTHSASVQKYKCLEKVRETVKEKSLTYEDLAN